MIGCQVIFHQISSVCPYALKQIVNPLSHIILTLSKRNVDSSTSDLDDSSLGIGWEWVDDEWTVSALDEYKKGWRYGIGFGLEANIAFTKNRSPITFVRYRKWTRRRREISEKRNKTNNAKKKRVRSRNNREQEEEKEANCY